MTGVTGIYYSHCDVPAVSAVCRQDLREAAVCTNTQILAVVPAHADVPTDWRRVAHEPRARGLLDAYSRILAGCRVAQTEYVALLEHDVIYGVRHFAIPIGLAGDDVLYNSAVYRLTRDGYFITPNSGGSTMVTSNASARREVMIREMAARIQHIEAGGRLSWSEPGRSTSEFKATCGTARIDWAAAADVRHGRNLTGSRAPKDGRYHATVARGLPSAAEFWARVDEAQQAQSV